MKKIIILLGLVLLVVFLSLLVYAARLPNLGGDVDNWGSLLNQYLLTQHTQDGKHKNVTIQGDLNVAGTLILSTPEWPIDEGGKYQFRIEKGRSNIVGAEAGSLALYMNDASSGDFSSKRLIAKIYPQGIPGQNANDGQIDFYQQTIHVYSDNNLAHGQDGWLDVGPQLVLARTNPQPPAGSLLGQIMLAGASTNDASLSNSGGVNVRYAELFARIKDNNYENPSGELVISTAAPPSIGAGSAARFIIGKGLYTYTSEGGSGLTEDKGHGTINVNNVYVSGVPVVTTTGNQNLEISHSGADSRISFTRTENRKYSIGNTGGDFTIRDESVNQERIRLVSNGNVGIGTTNPTSKLHVIGKATITGGVDPPYVSYSNESHKSIREYARDVEKHEKVMMFWNGNAHRIEVYVIEEDKFYTINGKLIE